MRSVIVAASFVAIHVLVCYRICAAQSFPVDPSLPLATGAFVQLNYGLASKTAAWWQTELGSMKSIGMDTVIVQYVAYNQSYYYPTNVAGGTPYAVDSVERILDAADQHGIKVFLGMHLDSGQYSGAFNLTANRAQGTATLNELRARYGSHSSLGGWYMPQEISDYTVFSEPALRDKLVTYTHDLTELAHTSSGLPMMISPYFGQNPNGASYANWWNTTGLPATGIDILALQDGVGTHRTNIAQSQAVFQAMAPVMAAHDVEFWGNNESFNQIHGWPVDAQPFAAVPTAIGTFTQQIQSTSPLVDKSVTFEYTTYLSTQGTAAAQVLHQAYEGYFALTTAPIPGDFNGDRVVDNADYGEWRSSFGFGGSQSADGNGDGTVNAADYVVWRNNLAADTAAAAGEAVPEPRTILYFLVGLFWTQLVFERREFLVTLNAKETLLP